MQPSIFEDDQLAYLAPHKRFWPRTASKLLQHCVELFGAHVRHVRPHEDYNILLGNRIFATQSSLIAEHCHNLTSASLCTYKAYPGSILAILRNNDCLERLDFNGGLYGEDSLSQYPTLTLPHLKQLKWYMKYGFDESVVTLVREAPNLQQLSLSCNSSKCTDIDDALIISVARAFPHLRTLSCKELHFEPSDRSLIQFLSLCTHVVNLDLSMHCELTDVYLIAALQHLPNLHCLDLRGCCRLTDSTLHFLAQRFASTLHVLYLDHSTHFDYDHGRVNVLGQLIMCPELKGGYTAEGIANLRAQCTRLHTYYYVLRIDEDLPRPPVEIYQLVTLVQVYAGYEALLPMILEHCQQLQIIAMLVDEYSGEQFILTEEQLMSFAARCPLLHTVIIEKNNEDAPQVDHSELKTRFSKLVFTESLSAVNFNMLEVPISGIICM